MSILGRLSNLIKSNLNAAVDKLSDPAKEVDLLITEMEEEMKKLRLELRDQLVREKMAQKKVDEEFRAVQKWQEHAERAVQAGDDELAKEALRRRAEAESRLEATEAAHAEHSRLTAKLSGQLKAGDAKLTEVKGKRETLKSRARQAQKAVDPEASAFDRFSTLVSQIEEKEHQAEALAEIAPELVPAVQADRDRETEARFDRLLASQAGQAEGGAALVKAAGFPAKSPKEAAVDARLAELKAKLDKKPTDG